MLRKVDLHVHTPVSTCYGEKSVTPENIVNAALAAGLQAIAVTDHNAYEGIQNVSQAGAGKGLVVFPGVELSTKEGHFVAIFDVGTSTSDIRVLLDAVGLTTKVSGDGHAVANADVETVLKTAHDMGAAVIAAHIDRWPSGFIETKQSRRIKETIHANGYLDALEITIAQNRTLWNDGLVRGYQKQYACIQSSDAHTTAEIGRRFVYIEMEQIGIHALHAAFADFRNKIIFPDQVAPDNDSV
jgi:predicted metal-dependent phosphoesterase TrpH